MEQSPLCSYPQGDNAPQQRFNSGINFVGTPRQFTLRLFLLHWLHDDPGYYMNHSAHLVTMPRILHPPGFNLQSATQLANATSCRPCLRNDRRTQYIRALLLTRSVCSVAGTLVDFLDDSACLSHPWPITAGFWRYFAPSTSSVWNSFHAYPTRISTTIAEQMAVTRVIEQYT